MQGFDYDRARKELRIPEEFQVEAMAVVGRPGPKESFWQHFRRTLSGQMKFGLTTDRLSDVSPVLDRARGGHSPDPKERSECACCGQRGTNHHHPAKSEHERFIDCATDKLMRSGIHIFRNVDGRELYRLSLQRLHD